MDDERFISGYCKLLDAPRTVTAENEDGQWIADCCYPDCAHAQSCPIAAELAKLAEN